MDHKFWQCECCGQLITTLKQDNAKEYICPACNKSRCDNGKFKEITLSDFCKEINIPPL